MFKAARVQEHLGVGVWGHIYPGWQKAWRYVKVFTFVFLARWGSLRIKKTAPIILHSKTILTNWKCREETFFNFFFFKKRAIVTPSSETQGNIAGARESLNGRENMARRKVKNGEFLRATFSRSFRLSLAPTICPWVSEDVVTPGRGILPI